jgi:hypothetical protein
MEKAISTTQPEQFKRDPDGSTVFSWDIEQIEGPMWQCNECRLYTTPTQANIERGAIESHLSVSDQALLLHDNNKSILATGKQTPEYAEFLTEVKKIKRAVRDYFNRQAGLNQAALDAITAEDAADDQTMLDMEARITALESAQESSGVSKYTPEQIMMYIDNQFASASTVAQVKTTVQELLKKIAVYVLK